MPVANSNAPLSGIGTKGDASPQKTYKRPSLELKN